MNTLWVFISEKNRMLAIDKKAIGGSMQAWIIASIIFVVVRYD